MIGYVTLGSNDLPRAFAFYDALLAEIGATRTWNSETFVAWGVKRGPAIATTNDDHARPKPRRRRDCRRGARIAKLWIALARPSRRATAPFRAVDHHSGKRSARGMNDSQSRPDLAQRIAPKNSRRSAHAAPDPDCQPPKSIHSLAVGQGNLRQRVRSRITRSKSKVAAADPQTAPNSRYRR